MGILCAPITAPIKIMGVTIYNPLPCNYFCDLDRECILPIGGEIDPFEAKDLGEGIDRVVNSGVLPNGVHWGITYRSVEGFADIFIDAPIVTEETIRQLIIAGVVTVPDPCEVEGGCDHCYSGACGSPE